MSPPLSEHRLEELARKIVSRELGVPVSRFEDGLAPSQPDAMIHLPEGNVPMEVVADYDIPHERQSAALKKLGPFIELPDGSQGWFVFIQHSADIRALRRELPRLLAGVRADKVGDDLGRDLPDEMRQLGVLNAYRTGNTAQAALTGEGWNSWDDSIQLNDWVERVLERESDVAAKLRKVGSAEGHAFIWATIGSAWWVGRTLINESDSAPERLPDTGPRLPEGVTTVWVAAYITRRGCLYYSEAEGWRRADWTASEETDT